MAPRFSLPLLRSIIALFVAGVGAASAQSLPYSVEMTEGTTARLHPWPEGYIEFHMTVKNLTDGALKLYVSRVLNDLPADPHWSTSICFDDLCFSDTTSNPPAMQFKAGQTRTVKINVIAGDSVNTSAHVKLRFSTEFGMDTSSKFFSVTLTNEAAVNTTATAIAAGAYPNPATTYAMIPMPVGYHSAGNATLTLHDALGREVANLSAAAADAASAGNASVRVALDGLASGTYRYLLNVAGATTSGPIVIVR